MKRVIFLSCCLLILNTCHAAGGHGDGIFHGHGLFGPSYGVDLKLAGHGLLGAAAHGGDLKVAGHGLLGAAHGLKLAGHGLLGAAHAGDLKLGGHGHTNEISSIGHEFLAHDDLIHDEFLHSHPARVINVIEPIPHVVKRPAPVPVIKYITLFRTSRVGAPLGGHIGGPHGHIGGPHGHIGGPHGHIGGPHGHIGGPLFGHGLHGATHGTFIHFGGLDHGLHGGIGLHGGPGLHGGIGPKGGLGLHGGFALHHGEHGYPIINFGHSFGGHHGKYHG